MAMVMKYRVGMIESEAGWGQKYYNVDFDSYEEARNYINEINTQNQQNWDTAGRFPSWYIQPESDKVVAVEVE
jgi:hypothetical protein